ncbi:phosphotransferase [Bacillus sp. AK128]
MNVLNQVVLPTGELNSEMLYKREILYKGMNGRYVERIYITPTESYIFKPLTNNDQLGKEIWIQTNILTSINPTMYPKILSYSLHNVPYLNWYIIEDLGTLQHAYNEETLLEVTNLMAKWHGISIDRAELTGLNGPKPLIEDMISHIISNKNVISQKLNTLSISMDTIEHLYNLLNQQEFSTEKVFSHGDLHLGNYAFSLNKMYVLDWEHAHLNSPYWDLYHLIDLSHPIFPKNEITSQLRNQVLAHYLNQMGQLTEEKEKQNFKNRYYLYASAFSIWMLLLIWKDLEEKELKWPKESLLNQLSETTLSLQQCLSELTTTQLI